MQNYDKIKLTLYEPWGNVTSVALNLDGGEANPDEDELAKINPFRYRGYYYDEESGLYYLQTRYYDPSIGQFISPDSFEYLDPEELDGLNLYNYCGNNPIMNVDPTGEFWDTVFDIFFIGWDILNLCKDEGYKDVDNWLALGIDVLFATIPFVSGGGGQVVKFADMADNLNDIKKLTVIGETMNRVQDTATLLGHADDIYHGFKAYDKLSNLGKAGKLLAEVGGKVSNATWLYTKLRTGYKIIDIGIDIARVTRSSSYLMERIIVNIWRYRNIWKWIYHIF